MKRTLQLPELAAYLPYGVLCQYKRYIDDEIVRVDLTLSDASYLIERNEFKLILRPLSELELYAHLLSIGGRGVVKRMTNLANHLSFSDVCVLLKNHYDVFGLIEAGLAIDINTIQK